MVLEYICNIFGIHLQYIYTFAIYLEYICNIFGIHLCPVPGKTLVVLVQPSIKSNYKDIVQVGL